MPAPDRDDPAGVRRRRRPSRSPVGCSRRGRGGAAADGAVNSSLVHEPRQLVGHERDPEPARRARRALGVAILVGLADRDPRRAVHRAHRRGAVPRWRSANLGRAIPSYAHARDLRSAARDRLLERRSPALRAAGDPADPHQHLRRAAGGRPRHGRGGRGAWACAERQILRSVEVPLALPVIIAGIRIAAVQVVATATLAALVGGGALGRFIVDGFALQDYDACWSAARSWSRSSRSLTGRLFTFVEGRAGVARASRRRRRRAVDGAAGRNARCRAASPPDRHVVVTLRHPSLRDT